MKAGWAETADCLKSFITSAKCSCLSEWINAKAHWRQPVSRWATSKWEVRKVLKLGPLCYTEWGVCGHAGETKSVLERCINPGERPPLTVWPRGRTLALRLFLLSPSPTWTLHLHEEANSGFQQPEAKQMGAGMGGGGEFCSRFWWVSWVWESRPQSHEVPCQGSWVSKGRGLLGTGAGVLVFAEFRLLY